MEIRTLHPDEREALGELLDALTLTDGWKAGAFYRRYREQDPTYADENVWVALEGGRPQACVQVFPRRVRVLGHAVPSGGIGSHFTAPEQRGSGIAGKLLEAAVDAMVRRGLELSLVFGDERRQFYRNRGWASWQGERTILRMSEGHPPLSGEQRARDGEIEIAPFDRGRDFAAVKAIHSAYSASRNGTVVRDDALWEASLKLAGNPDEEFLVARRGGNTVAYVRVALLGGLLTVTELARREDAASPLALLMASTLEPREGDFLASGRLSSPQLRSSSLLPAFDDLQLTVAMEQRGIASHPVDNPSTMLRCLDMPALARRLDVSLFPGESAEEFLARILPRDSLVFWPADRF
ncbi:MAG: GNAT family N-acetyltransferase [Deltaproteobacteria bacterium]|nr:GNAT family N-acetyltransferase [Deltaproteobacteria bacterium]MBW2417159.1 GNAT family N-acetyltransferase [Deltaproteobacteria bacterium]